MSKIDNAIRRGRAFAASWGDEDLIDEESGFTRADLDALIAAADAGKRLAELPPPR